MIYCNTPFEQWHPAVQLESLVDWYWRFVEGEDCKSQKLFTENIHKASDDILKYAHQVSHSIYCTAIASLCFDVKCLTNKEICPLLYEGYKARLDKINQLWKNKATSSIIREKILCKVMCKFILLNNPDLQ